MRQQPFLHCSIRAMSKLGKLIKELIMTHLPPGPIRAEDPLAYFTALPVLDGVAGCPPRSLTALKQMYAYYTAPIADLRP